MRTRIPSALYALVCVVSLLAWSCSSTDSGSSQEGKQKVQVAKAAEHRPLGGTAGFNLCDKLTESDIREFFPDAPIKITNQGDKVFDTLGTRKCFYELSDGDMIFIQTVLMRTRDMKPSLQEEGRTAEGNYLATKEYVENLIPVEGLGKDAYYGGSGLKMGAGLHVLLDKDTCLSVSVGLGRGNDDDQAHLRIEKALAERIISRL